MRQASHAIVARRRMLTTLVVCALALLAYGSVIARPAHAMSFYCDHSTTAFSGMAPNLEMNHYYATDGTVAYCLDPDLHGPLEGMLFETEVPADIPIAYVLSHGYPNTTTIDGVSFDENEAREITQLACWFAQGQLSYDDATPSDERGQRMKDAAARLAAAGSAYQPDDATLSTPEANGQGIVRPLGDGAYFRWGPYRVEGGETVPSTVIENWPDFASHGAFTGDDTGTYVDTTRVGWDDWYLYLPVNAPAESPTLTADVRVRCSTLPTYCFWTDPLMAGIDPSTIQRMLYATPARPNSLDSSGSFSLTFGSVDIVKHDALTDAPVAGATFSIEQFDGQAWRRVTDVVTGSHGDVRIGGLPTGFTYRAVEVGAPPGYLTPDESGTVGMAEFTVDASSATPATVTFEDFERPTASVSKVDADTREPVGDTEYQLYRWTGRQVSVIDGTVRFSSEPAPGDRTNWASDEEGWEPIATGITNEDGLLTWDPATLSYGYYRTVETRPHRLYQTVGETLRKGDPNLLSGEDAQYFTLDASSSDEVQLFSNRAITLACEVYKSTIGLTSAAFDEREQGGSGVVSNVAMENYLYRVGFRSTSNTWADEFVVEDSLAAVREGQVRVRKLWTPVAWGDHDGLMNVWYRTNLTDDEAVYDTANASLANPENPNTLHGARATDYRGWRLWKEGVVSTQCQMLSVDDLGLADGEYLTAIRLEYGCVERGFKAGERYDGIGDPGDPWYAEEGERASTSALVYTVECPEGLRPRSSGGRETIIGNDVTDTIFRNTSFTLDATGTPTSVSLTLWDEDADSVETRVIDTFAVAGQSNGISAGAGPSDSLPRTGDADWGLLSAMAAVGSVALSCGIALRVKGRRREGDRRKGTEDERRIEAGDSPLTTDHAR